MTLRTQQLDLRADRRWLCRGLNLRCEPGEVWGILGLNGCGKTTLLHALAGLRQPEGGEIYLGGRPLPACSRREIAQAMGVLLQDTHFTFSQTVYDYCSAARFPHLGPWQKQGTADRRIVEDALSQMQLHTLAARQVTSLSGGEKRRAATAALIAQTPRIYLLDEPCNHLDIPHQLRILDYFRQQARQGALIIMSLHDVNLAQRFCDKVLLMLDEGESLQGSTATVLIPANVTRLYQHTMQLITQGENKFWLL